MAKIELQKSSAFLFMPRNYRVYIDGKKIGEISNAKTKEFELSPGEHVLCLKVDWFSTGDCKISVSENEIKKLKVSSFVYSVVFFVIAILALPIGPHILKYFDLNPCFSLLLLLPFLYQMTIGRNKYLRISEV